MPSETSLPGVFAAGDVRHGSVERVASAVGEGSAAIRAIHQYPGQGWSGESTGRASRTPGAGYWGAWIFR